MKSIILGLVAALLLSKAALADDLKAEPKFDGATVAFNVPSNVANLTLSVAGPNDFHASASARGGSPIINLRDSGAVEDGAYTYNLTASTEERLTSRSRLDNGRGNAEPGFKSVATSGTFNVRGGVIVPVKSRPPVTDDSKRRQDQQ
jgi:hypothetical protein